MSNLIRLQTTGILAEIKEKAEKQAVEQGFGSLNDAVRMFVNQFAHGRIQIGGFKPRREEYLSPERLAEYEREAQEALELVRLGKKKSYGKGEIQNMVLDLLNEEDEEVYQQKG
jgi:hypothetical protein